MVLYLQVPNYRKCSVKFVRHETDRIEKIRSPVDFLKPYYILSVQRLPTFSQRKYMQSCYAYFMISSNYKYAKYLNINLVTDLVFRILYYSIPSMPSGIAATLYYFVHLSTQNEGLLH